MSPTTTKTLSAALFLVLCVFAFFRLRAVYSHQAKTWVDRTYHISFRWDGEIKTIAICDAATGKPEPNQVLQAVAVREARSITEQVMEQTRIKTAEGEFYLSVEGYQQPFLIRWFRVKIPALAQFMSAAAAQDPETVRASLAKGIDADARDLGNGRTALIWASGDAARGVSPTILKCLRRPQDKRVLDVLLAAGADPNAKDINGLTALMRADPNQMKTLLQYGADLNARDNEGRTALIYAVDFGTLERCIALIRAGADLNIADKQGWTALMYAANEADVSKTELLLRSGANRSAIDQNGETALAIVSKKKQRNAADERIINLLGGTNELRQ